MGDPCQDNIHGVRNIDTIDVIYRYEVPQYMKVTYATYVLNHISLKEEQYQVRITVGGDRLTYLEDVGSSAGTLLKIKVLIILQAQMLSMVHISCQQT